MSKNQPYFIASESIHHVFSWLVWVLQTRQKKRRRCGACAHSIVLQDLLCFIRNGSMKIAWRLMRICMIFIQTSSEIRPFVLTNMGFLISNVKASTSDLFDIIAAIMEKNFWNWCQKYTKNDMIILLTELHQIFIFTITKPQSSLSSTYCCLFSCQKS